MYASEKSAKKITLGSKPVTGYIDLDIAQFPGFSYSVCKIELEVENKVQVVGAVK